MKAITLSLLFLPVFAFSQKSKKTGDDLPPIPHEGKSIVYTEVVSVDSASAEDLYARAKKFFVEAYKSAKDVIQLDDPKNGELIGKGNFKIYWDRGLLGSEETRVKHTIAVYVKDGRYKYEIKELTVEYYQSGSRIGTSYVSGYDVSGPLENYELTDGKSYRRYVSSVHSAVLTTIQELKTFMTKKQETKKSNW